MQVFQSELDISHTPPSGCHGHPFCRHQHALTCFPYLPIEEDICRHQHWISEQPQVNKVSLICGTFRLKTNKQFLSCAVQWSNSHLATNGECINGECYRTYLPLSHFVQPASGCSTSQQPSQLSVMGYLIIIMARATHYWQNDFSMGAFILAVGGMLINL